MLKNVILIVSVLLLSQTSLAQRIIAHKNQNGTYTTKAKVVQNDTIPHVNLSTYVYFGDRKFKSQQAYKRYKNLQRNVVKVYPYAKLAGKKYLELKPILDTLTDNRIRKKYFKEIEKELLKTYGNELKELTITQGRILIKLIDRETSQTSYDLVDDMRGHFSAFFWQSIAKLFGNDLKADYDPNGADALIEEIILQIENGQI